MKIRLPQDIFSNDYKDLTARYSPYQHDFEKWSAACTVCLTPSQQIIFILRSTEMPTHKGEIGFFGGHRHQDDNSPKEAATREFGEETGLDSKFVGDFIGHLPPVLAGSRTLLIPSLFQTKVEFGEQSQYQLISNGEWDKVFSYSLDEFYPKKNWEHFIYHGQDQGVATKNPIYYFQMKKDQIKTLGSSPNALAKNLDYPEPFLFWGASARIIWNLVSLADQFV